MRKDIFIVGARLLGIWQLLAGLSPLASILYAWLRPFQQHSYTQEYEIMIFAVHLLTGLYLLFRTDSLFRLMVRLNSGDTAESGEIDFNENIKS